MASYSGLWNGVYGTPYSIQVNRASEIRQIGRVMKRRSTVRMRKVVDTVVAGSSINGGAATTYKRASSTVDPGNAIVNGGLRTIDTVTQIAASQLTLAADATKVDAMVLFRNKPASYPTDRSGNGGGGKSGYSA